MRVAASPLFIAAMSVPPPPTWMKSYGVGAPLTLDLWRAFLLRSFPGVTIVEAEVRRWFEDQDTDQDDLVDLVSAIFAIQRLACLGPMWINERRGPQPSSASPSDARPWF